MTSRHKDFGSPSDISDDIEPLTFTLHGKEFECHPALPGAVLLDFVRVVDSSKDSGTPKALLMLFDRAIIDEDKEAFDELINSPDVAIPVETLGEIASWMVETYTKRPTKRVSSLSGGRSRTGRRSTEDASSAESTLED